jgi:hypothetical protein
MRSTFTSALTFAVLLLATAGRAEAPSPKTPPPLRHPLTAGEAEKLLTAHVNSLEGKVPAAHQKRAASDVETLLRSVRQSGGEASAILSRGQVVGVEIHARRGDERNGETLTRVTWPLEGTSRVMSFHRGLATQGSSLRPVSEDEARRIRASEPGAAALEGPLVLYSEKSLSVASEMGPGPDLRRLAAVEAFDGRRVALVPPSKPRTEPRAETPLSSRAPRVLDGREHARALEMLVEGAKRVSRTATDPSKTYTFTKRVEDAGPRVNANIESASRYVLEHHADLPVNLETAEKLHGMLTVGVEEHYSPRPVWRRALESAFRWLDSPDGHALEKADPVAFAERVHFFLIRADSLDGANGRTGRLLADLALLKNGMSPARYVDQQEHFAATGPQVLYPELTEAKRVEYFRQRVADGEAFLKAR